MKIAITNDKEKIVVYKELDDLKYDNALLCQTIAELEILKLELIQMYKDTGEERDVC